MTNETGQGLERISWLPDRDDSENGAYIAGQKYYDVYFTGGTITGITLSGNIDGAAITNSTINSSPIGDTSRSTGKFTTLAANQQITSTIADGTAPLVVTSTTRVSNLNVAQAGLADTITVADAGGDTITFPMLATDATGNLAPKTDAGLTYNATTNALTATTFVGAVTGNASTATALATGRTIAITGDLAYTSPSFDGTSNITAAGTLAAVNSNVGTFGSATQVIQQTVNAKGLTTAASNVSIQIAESQVTNLTTDLAAKQPLDATLTALAAYNTTAFMAQTAADTFAGRTLQSGTGISISNPAGTAGDPTISFTGVQTKISSFTRDQATASGTQAITGVGFTPKMVVFMSTLDGTVYATWGFDNASGAASMFANNAGTADNYGKDTAKSITLAQTGSNFNQANITSMDADGFTLTWTKTGSPTGTATIIYLAIK